MSPHYLIAILALLFLLLTSAIDQSAGSAPFGAWMPLKNISDPYVTEIANFAVTAYNSQKHKNLLFQKVINGYYGYHMESGTRYRLVVRVKNEKSVVFPTADYLAYVLEESSAGDKQLVSFAQISN